jgi:hypothetical protein
MAAVAVPALQIALHALAQRIIAAVALLHYFSQRIHALRVAKVQPTQMVRVV